MSDRKNKSGLVLSIIQRKCARKMAKHTRETEQLLATAEQINSKKALHFEKIATQHQKAELIEQKIISLKNSNNFLESSKGQSASIDKVVNLLIYRNNRQIIALVEKKAEYTAKADALSNRSGLFDKDIEAVNKKAEYHRRLIDSYRQKSENIGRIGAMNLSNQALSYLLSKNSEAIAEDIQKYCYKEVLVRELPLLESVDYSERRSKVNSATAIIKFERSFKETVDKALAASGA